MLGKARIVGAIDSGTGHAFLTAGIDVEWLGFRLCAMITSSYASQKDLLYHGAIINLCSADHGVYIGMCGHIPGWCGASNNRWGGASVHKAPGYVDKQSRTKFTVEKSGSDFYLRNTAHGTYLRMDCQMMLDTSV